MKLQVICPDHQHLQEDGLRINWVVKNIEKQIEKENLNLNLNQKSVIISLDPIEELKENFFE